MVKRCLGCMQTYDDYDKVCPHCGYIDGTAPENAMHLMPGTVLNNRFTVGKVVGYGGFGVTYLGWDKVLAQKVAIKEYLPSEFSTRAPGNTFVTIFDGDKKEQFNTGKYKFVDEAKRLSKFTECPGIVKVFDSFVENDTAYIVMEYVEGVTLEDYFKERRIIPAEEALLMMLPVIESLQKVHETGIIHRDISPNNIMVSEEGDVKVIDFGAARFATATHTKSMTVIIKPGYSPEEQYMSRGDQGPHTDVYAVGATLYKMITGVVPPDAMERRAQFQAKGKDILEPISKYNKDISKNLENAIMNAMNVEISTRTPDMTTFMYELTTDEPVARKNGKIKITDVYRWPIWLKITLPVAAMLILTLSVLFGMGVIGFDKKLNEEMQLPDGMVKVPWVVNKTQEEAAVLMTERQLLMITAAGDYSDDIEAGMVMGQDTTGGAAVFANSRVYVTLSRGKEMKTIPASVALYAEAQVVKTTLEELGFVVTLNEESEYSNIPQGLVTALVTEDGQLVEANIDLPARTGIIITASKGLDPNVIIEDKKVKVPNFVNLTKQQAYELAGVELSVKIEDKYKEGYEPGIIWYQSVDADTGIDNVVVITLYASVLNTVKVPNVIGANYNAAKQELESIGLVCEFDFTEHESYAKDVVFVQSHEQGALLEQGTVIRLTVSKGAGKQDVPDVTGKDETTAKDTLLQSGYVVSVNYANIDTVASGKVISQDIVGTKVAMKGDTVTITVSSGEKLFVVPDVVGKDKKTASELLENAGFSVEIYEQYDDYVSAGMVVTQSEKAGVSLKKGANILIAVSLGVEMLDVPDVTGKDETTAKNTLSKLGYVVSVKYTNSDTVASGKVISQDIIGTKVAKKGDIIRITVSSGEQLFKVPNVVGKDKTTAVNSLTAMGFVVEVVEKYDESLATGIVMAQSEAAGTSHAKGTKVVLTVSKGAASWSDWVATLPSGVTSDDYIIEEMDYYRTVSAGKVISQSVASGSKAKLGSNVHLVISKGVAAWSEWTTDTSLMNDSKYEYEAMTETQWNYNEWYTTTSNQNTMSGWTLYDTTWDWSGYGGWSGWSTTPITPTDEVAVENKTQYRYRDKQTTKGTSNTMSGWSLYNTTWEWGPFSAETTNVLTAPNSDSEVSTRQETTYKTITKYRGKSLTWRSPKGETWPEKISSTGVMHTYSYAALLSYNKTIIAKPTTDPGSYSDSWYDGLTTSNYKYNEIVSPWTTTAPEVVDGTGYYGIYKMDNGGYYYEYETTTETEEISITYYKIRHKIYTYHFWKWDFLKMRICPMTL